MNINDKLIFSSIVICVFVIYYPSQNNGKVLDAIQNITNRSNIKSYISDSYYSLSNKVIENVALSVIEKQRAKLQAEEPFVYNFKKTFNFSEAQFKGKGTLQNVTLPDASQFVVKNLTSNKQDNEVNFEIFFKKFTADDVNYNVQGKALTNIPINGRGKIKFLVYTRTIFSATFSNVTIQGQITFTFDNSSYQIKNMQLHYTFDNFELTINGLTVPLLSPASLNRLLSREVTNYLRKNEKEISAKASKTIRKQINKKLRNFSFFNFMRSLWAALSPLKTPAS